MTARPAASPATTGRGPVGNRPETSQLNPAILPATATGNRPDAAATDAANARPLSGRVSCQLSASVSAGWPQKWPLPEDPAPDTIADTLGWIEAKAASASSSASGPAPLLGTAAWRALPDNDPARWAALCRAAAAWFREYVTIGDRVRSEVREEFERFEAYAVERDRVHYAPLRQAANEAAAGIERRARAAARDLPNRTGPELIAAAHASWGLAPPETASPEPPGGPHDTDHHRSHLGRGQQGHARSRSVPEKRAPDLRRGQQGQQGHFPQGHPCP